MKLANILPDQEPDARRGPDLRFKVQVPKSALGKEGGYRVQVPSALEHEGAMIQRARSPFEDGDSIRLQLPETLPEGAVLRLRGQGGVLEEEGSPGDLYLEIGVREGPSPLIWLALGAAVVIAVALIVFR